MERGKCPPLPLVNDTHTWPSPQLGIIIHINCQFFRNTICTLIAEFKNSLLIKNLYRIWITIELPYLILKIMDEIKLILGFVPPHPICQQNMLVSCLFNVLCGIIVYKPHVCLTNMIFLNQ